MLTRELMGLLCVGIVWVTALLVAAAAGQDLGDLLRLWRRARRGHRATVESGEGAEGVFAEWSIDQRGRALDTTAPAIAFHDRAFHSKIHGGTVRVGEQVYRVNGPGEVWVSAEARAAAAACSDAASFDSAYAQATRAAGFQRQVRLALRKDDPVFVLGQIAGDALVGGREPLVLSTFDPRGPLGRQALALAAFIPVELAGCAAATWLALTRPHFGTVSVIGALLCLAFFLGVTPIAVALRERVRRPSEAYLRGTWSRRLVPGA